MIDWQQVAILREEVGPDDFGEVSALFLKEAEDALVELRDNPNPALLQARLHGLKGAALTLGFVDLAALCRDGEAAASNGKPVDTNNLNSLYFRSKAAFLARG